MVVVHWRKYWSLSSYTPGIVFLVVQHYWRAAVVVQNEVRNVEN